MTKNEKDSRVKIVVLDGYAENPGDLSWDGLRDLGDLTVYDRTDRTDEDGIVRRIGDAQMVFTNKTPISGRVIDACPNLRFISVLATGYDVVDIRHAAGRGIPVCNVPAYGTEMVAQYSIAMLLEICCHVGHHNDTVHAGRWTDSPDWCYWDYPLIELAGKTLGIIGFGRIGRAEGKIARALGMRVIANSPHPTREGRLTAEYVDLDELYAQADVISLHCTLNENTAGLIDRAAVEKMKDGVILLNNARGGLLNEKDVADALRSGKIAAAGLDVVSAEPIRADNPLLSAPNCLLTPHISWAAKECRARIMEISVQNAEAFLAGTPIHTVNGGQSSSIT